MKVGEGLRQNWGPVPALALGCELSDKAGRSKGHEGDEYGRRGCPRRGDTPWSGFREGDLSEIVFECLSKNAGFYAF